MGKRCLPLNFYCRSARLLLKKASFSRRSNLLADELRHLKKFTTLAFSVIPSHPEYQDDKGRKLAEELEDCMDDVRERIAELEEDLSSSSACSTTAGYPRSSPLGDRNVRHPPDRHRIWEKLVTKLYAAASYAPCFSSGKVSTKMKKLVPPMTGHLSTSYNSMSEARYPFLNSVDSQSSSESKGQQLVLDMRHRRIERQEDSGSEDSESTTRSQLMTQIAEANSLNVEGKLLNIQTIVMDLRDSVESLKTRIEEEGKRWRGRAETLERKLKVMKDETENDFTSLKQQFQEEVRKAARENEHKVHLEQKLERLMESSTGEVVDFKKQVNEFITDSLGEVRSELRNHINNLEIGLSKDVDNLRQEMGSRYEAMLIDAEMGRIGGQQIMKQKLDKEDERPSSAEVTKQLETLRGDIQSLHRDVDKVNDEQRVVRKQVQSTKQEVMEARVDTEVWIKDCELQVKEMRHDMIELRGEQEEIKADVEVLKKPQQQQQMCPSRPEGGAFPLEFASNLLMVEKLEKFSKLYTGCLNDLQARVTSLEAAQKSSPNPEDTAALIEKERSLNAVATVSKTKEMLQDALGTFLSQILSSKGGKNVQQQLELSTELEQKKVVNKSLKMTVHRLNRQMKEVFERLTYKAGVNKKLSVGMVKAGMKKDGKFSNEMIISIDNKMKAAAGVMSQLNGRIHRLETVQDALGRSLQNVQKGNQVLQKAASFWLPKYEATATLVTEVACKIEQLKPQQSQPAEGAVPTLSPGEGAST